MSLPGCPGYVSAPTGKTHGVVYGHGPNRAGLSRKVAARDAVLAPISELYVPPPRSSTTPPCVQKPTTEVDKL